MTKQSLTKDPHLMSHEEICMIRYTNINEKLDTILKSQQEHYQEIQTLKQTVAMGTGAIKTLLVIGSFISVGWGLIIGVARFVKG